MRRHAAVLTIAATLGCSGMMVLAQDSLSVDPRLPSYRMTEGVAGNIKSVGSDTMNNLMALWAEGFRRMYPNVQVEIEGKGSSTAPPALIKGTSTFGPMSREMKSAELDSFEERFGYKPTPLRTAIDMLALYVHKDNPIAKTGLTLQQVDAMFSKTRKGGHPNEIRTWGQLGLTGEWKNRPISLYGRNAASGTYGYFKKHALFKGDYKDTVKEQPGSSAVVQGVARDLGGIGYSGIGYKTADVAIVRLAPDSGSDFIAASPENADEYPLARFLYLYVNHKPGYQLDPLRAQFLQYVFSKEGQSDVIKDGYLPVAAAIAGEDLHKIGAELGR
ncbi:MAG: PstS family phosphate ABC transporter substrate-binding protein [Planctomycetota bacterium]|jgi:phosphate transport system substrate-binding protein